MSATNRLPMSPCRRCGKAHVNRNGYCADHQELAVGWRKRQVGKTTTQRGYGHSWRKKRERILKRDKYCCVLCRLKGLVVGATEVDHIKPKEFGGSDDDDNLQSLCNPCHTDKTRNESLLGRQMALGEGDLKV